MEQNQYKIEEYKQKDKKPTWIFGYAKWVLWIISVLFFGQNTFASMYENETRAAMIYAAFTILLLMGGGIVFITRKYNY